MASELLATEPRRVLLVTGAAGVGKSRLLDELSVLAEQDGWMVHRAIAAPATAEFSLAPFGHLEPTGVPLAQDPGERLARLAAVLKASAGDQPLLLVVDDAHHLDPASLALVHQLVVQDRARVAFAIRDGHAVPETVLGLTTADRGAPLPLAPLDREGSDALLASLLGGPVAPSAATAIWDLALGNPLFTREITTTGRELGVLGDDGQGRWQLDGPLAVSTVLRDQLGRRLTALDPAAKEVILALAVTEVLRLAVIEDLAPFPVVSDLERRELLAFDGPAQQTIRLAHPLFAEVARTTASVSELHDARRRVAAALRRAEPSRDDELALAATLMLDSGQIDAEFFAAAAERALAQFDSDRAVRLTAAVLSVDDGPLPRLAHARALSQAGKGAEAENELAALARLDLGDDWLVNVTLVQAQDLMFRGARADEGILLLQSRIDAVPLDKQVPLRAFLGWLAFFTGDLDASVDAVTPVLQLDDVPLVALQGAQSVSSIVGDPGNVLALFEIVLASLERDGLPPGTGVATLGNFFFGRLLALWQLGRSPEADDPFAPVRHLALPQLDAPQFAFGMDAPQQFIRGHLDRAAADCWEIADIMWRFEMPVWTYNLTLGTLAEAMRGNLDVARSRLAEVDATPPAHRLVFQSWVERARLWIAAGEGDIAGAIESSLAIADAHAKERFHATISLHDVVRLGAAERVVERLEMQAARPGATWWDVICRDHACAVSAGDADLLADVAARFEAGGLDLHAAEALMQLTKLLAPGERHAATTARLAIVLARCGTVRTPVFAELPPLLSERESQVARLAANGLTNREIADRLGTSERTVGNQLQRVYDKLGIHDRGTLRAALDRGTLT